MLIRFIALIPSLWAFPTALPRISEDLEHSMSSIHSQLSTSNYLSNSVSSITSLFSSHEEAEAYISKATSISSDVFQGVASAFPNSFSLIDRVLGKLRKV